MKVTSDKRSQIIWEINEAAAQAPITDDPDHYFGHLDLAADEDDCGMLDEHSRFLVGDWPR